MACMTAIFRPKSSYSTAAASCSTQPRSQPAKTSAMGWEEAADDDGLAWCSEGGWRWNCWSGKLWDWRGGWRLVQSGPCWIYTESTETGIAGLWHCYRVISSQERELHEEHLQQMSSQERELHEEHLQQRRSMRSICSRVERSTKVAYCIKSYIVLGAILY
jgi:hypothetical protein